MQYKKQITKTANLLLAIAFLATVVVAIRYYLIESYRISTPSMENTLAEGDFILVNKYKSLPDRNKVILFNSPLLKDTVSSPLFISRCIGLPGDTISINSDGYTINGHFFPLSPNAISQYQVEASEAEPFLNVLKKLQIPVRELKNVERSIQLSLTPFEEYAIREELTEDISRAFIKLALEEYTLIVPCKNRPYRLNPQSLTACKEAILCEAEKPISFRDDKLFLDGKETDFFFFNQDYYWVLSDNIINGIDSRHLGFIPANNILGTAWYCWLSPQAGHSFKLVQ